MGISNSSAQDHINSSQSKSSNSNSLFKEVRREIALAQGQSFFVKEICSSQKRQTSEKERWTVTMFFIDSRYSQSGLVVPPGRNSLRQRAETPRSERVALLDISLLTHGNILHLSRAAGGRYFRSLPETTTTEPEAR